MSLLRLFNAGDGVRALRADRILAIAIGIVALLIVALLVLLGNVSQLHERTLETIVAARSGRDEMQALTSALGDVEVARRAQLVREPAAATALADAAADARRRVRRLRALAAADRDLNLLTDHIAQAVEADLALATHAPVAATARVRTSLRTAMDYLRFELSLRNDAAREQERLGRERLGQVAWGLALLSIASSALALFVLRREREQWQRAHEAEAAAHAAAAASDLAKTRFLASASHDMRQPLHALALYLNALGKRIEGEEARDILAKAERATQSMIGMFATLLDLARVQAGAYQPEVAIFKLQDLFDRICSEHPGADITATPTFIQLRTDPLLLERLLRNLVANALKHGGGAARLEADSQAGRARISVADNGPGIAETDQARIFDEFVRLEGGRGGEGLGLGLAIVRRISELLGLRLELKSAPGEGATFTVYAPLAPTATAVAPAAPAAGAPKRLDADIAAVDDDPLALGALVGAMRDLGARVHAFGNEVELEAALQDGFRPALLITDLRIDGRLSGLDLARRVRSRLSPPPAVIVVTGDTEPETLDQLRASGHAWLIKPVDPAELARVAARAIS